MGKIRDKAIGKNYGLFEYITRKFTGLKYMSQYNVRVVTDTNYISEYSLYMYTLTDAIGRVSLLEYGTRNITISDEDGNVLAEKDMDNGWDIVDKRMK